MKEIVHKYLDSQYIIEDDNIRTKDTGALVLFGGLSLREDLLRVFGTEDVLDFGLTWLESHSMKVNHDYFDEPPPPLLEKIRELVTNLGLDNKYLT